LQRAPELCHVLSAQTAESGRDLSGRVTAQEHECALPILSLQCVNHSNERLPPALRISFGEVEHRIRAARLSNNPFGVRSVTTEPPSQISTHPLWTNPTQRPYRQLAGSGVRVRYSKSAQFHHSNRYQEVRSSLVPFL
jgi:hypothetical protein